MEVIKLSKRKDTLEIEQALIKATREGKSYGCEEITIGFVNQGYGNEIVDFMTMDSKGVFRCYEIKVTVEDLKSHAKKSWYGHYNYLVVSQELYSKISDWSQYLPSGVGVIRYGYDLEVVIKPKRQNVSSDMCLILSQSMSRSMYYKMLKYYNSQDLENIKKLQGQIRNYEQKYKESASYATELRCQISRFLRLKRKNEGKKVTLDDLIDIEKEKAGISEDELF